MRRWCFLQNGYVVMMWMLLIIVLLTGCKTVEYVPVDRARVDTVYVYRQHSDTLVVRDSIYVEKGDTMKEYRYKYIYAYRDRVDTLYISKTDSVSVPYPVEKRLTRWQQIKQDMGGLSFTLVFVFIFIVFGKMVYKLRK